MSPCSNNCNLGDDQICLGCHRSIDEIIDWSNMGTDQKMKILERCNASASLNENDTRAILG
ncbi:DUF1289 domain-containing protein [Rubritalea profundi]